MVITKEFELYDTGKGYCLSPIGYIEGMPFSVNDYEFLLERKQEDYDKIEDWFKAQFVPYLTRKSFNEYITSYGIKHIAERELGFYVCNADIKLLTLENGVEYKKYPHSPNITYKLSKDFYKRQV